MDKTLNLALRFVTTITANKNPEAEELVSSRLMSIKNANPSPK